MKTKTIFDAEGVQVWETDNKDARGKEWHLTDGTYTCSVGFKPEFDPQWIKQYLVEYRKDRQDSLDTEIKETIYDRDN
jgi:hypothetical protein